MHLSVPTCLGKRMQLVKASARSRCRQGGKGRNLVDCTHSCPKLIQCFVRHGAVRYNVLAMYRGAAAECEWPLGKDAHTVPSLAEGRQGATLSFSMQLM